MFTLPIRLFRARPLPAPPSPPRPGERVAADGERPVGCGWFDSSHELASGLTVWEGIIVVDNTVATPS